MEYKCQITTIDNPFDPFDQYRSWRMFDVEKGYYTSEFVARLVELSDDMTEQEEDEAYEKAIDEIIKRDFLNIYVKVKKPRTDE